jgi:glycosyltransferase involved in cell wall biosynthesis
MLIGYASEDPVLAPIEDMFRGRGSEPARFVILRYMDFVVLSHLRWDFVFQRPQHLLTRCSQNHRVFFWEEPVFSSGSPRLRITEVNESLTTIVPELPGGISAEQNFRAQERLLSDFIAERAIEDFVLWYYTPMALNFSRDLQPSVVVYDCMDELSAFRGAPPELRQAESELFDRADVVFVGGRTLYESKRPRHPNVHLFPSSIDRQHFGAARKPQNDPEDQKAIPHPRFGYCGVLDERLDLELLAQVAELKPDWQLVMIGPVTKISDDELPKAPNIHYLGAKKYSELPNYMSGWEIGILPFALNESTKFISPTKTPEYLAAGLRVISTPLTDVLTPYGELGLAEIVSDAKRFVSAGEKLLKRESNEETEARESSVNAFLSQNSWDLTWLKMWEQIQRIGENSSDSAVEVAQQEDVNAD